MLGAASQETNSKMKEEPFTAGAMTSGSRETPGKKATCKEDELETGLLPEVYLPLTNEVQ